MVTEYITQKSVVLIQQILNRKAFAPLITLIPGLKCMNNCINTTCMRTLLNKEKHSCPFSNNMYNTPV